MVLKTVCDECHLKRRCQLDSTWRYALDVKVPRHGFRVLEALLSANSCWKLVIFS
jgi:hypothetical protein